LAKQGTGIYQCYCEKFGSTGLIVPEDLGICETYCLDQAWGLTLSTTISVGITVINMIIREISIVLIKKIGYKTYT